MIVTANLRDFPLDYVSQFGIDVQHPDVFVEYLIDLHPELVCEIVKEQQSDMRNPPKSMSELLHALERSGLERSVALLRTHFLHDPTVQSPRPRGPKSAISSNRRRYERAK